MAKLAREQKIEIYKRRKSGESIADLSKRYDISYDNVKYLVKLIDRHGKDILRNDKNNYYSPKLKIEIINKVLLEKKSVKLTAAKCGLSSAGRHYGYRRITLELIHREYVINHNKVNRVQKSKYKSYEGDMNRILNNLLLDKVIDEDNHRSYYKRNLTQPNVRDMVYRYVRISYRSR